MRISRSVVTLAAFIIFGAAISIAQTNASCSYTSFQVPGASGTTAVGINDYNSVVGYASDISSRQLIGFIRWADGSFSKVSVPGSMRTILLGRNNKGISVGSYADARGEHAFLLTSSGFQTVDYPGAVATELLGINNYNSSVGDALTSNARDGLKRWSNGGWVKVQYPNSTGTQINGINDSGVMVGVDAPDSGPGTMVAFAVIHGKFQQITDPKADRLSTWVNGINNNQVIVGTGYNGGKPPKSSHGFFFKNGQIHEMSMPAGASSLEANGINKAGLIVGTASFGGTQQGFIAKCQ